MRKLICDWCGDEIDSCVIRGDDRHKCDKCLHAKTNVAMEASAKKAAQEAADIITKALAEAKNESSS